MQWLACEKSDYKCPECRNHMVTTDELLDAASRLIGDKAMAEDVKPRFGIGMVMRNHGIVNPHPQTV